MLRTAGMTLAEIIVVLMILGIAAAIAFPSFTAQTEHAMAINAQNNLISIYAAQQNYNINYNVFCLNTPLSAQPACTATSSKCADTLAAINCNLSLNPLDDDGTYSYSCAGVKCTAIRNNASLQPVMVVTLNAPIQSNGGNPTCVAPAASWCP